ncbi:MAG TPA: DPP IV N-terminal domain-containing protein [Anaerolineae bacterium]|nr:DPP IV N-terminal domain-containing protein [Anaerolineae bacterium]
MISNKRRSPHGVAGEDEPAGRGRKRIASLFSCPYLVAGLVIPAALLLILVVAGGGRRLIALFEGPAVNERSPTPVFQAATPLPAVLQTEPPAASATATLPTLPTAWPTFTVAPRPTDTATPPPTATATPTATALPGTGLVAFESYRDGNGEIYVLDTTTNGLTNLTRHPADDKSPAWRPDGGAIAFASKRDGNWDLYVLDLSTGMVTRLTDDPAYDGAPAWSPDGREVAFESYRDGNLEIYVVDAAGGAPRRLTDNPAGDYGPAWHPDGSAIAFTSWRDGNKEVYLVPAGGGEARNLTQHPADDEDPAWAPDGTVPSGGALAFVSWRDVDAGTGNRNAEVYLLAVESGEVERLTENPWPDVDPAWDAAGRPVWATYEPGAVFEAYDPYRPGDYHLFRADAGWAAGAKRLTDADWDDRRPAPAPAQVVGLDGLADRLPPLSAAPTPMPTLAPGTLAAVVPVPEVVVSFNREAVLVNERVAPSLVAWQRDVLAASGWDFLGQTKGSWRNVDAVSSKQLFAHDYAYLSWHKTGRALDLELELKVDGRDQLVKVREDLGGSIYWRLYLRTARQDGSQGEPLKEQPWLFWWQIVESAEPEAYRAGGKRLPVPEGYYVDVTDMAKRHGWERIATYALEGDYDWHVHSNGTEYWHYERTDGLTWWEAMLEVYPVETLETHFAWEVGLAYRQSEEMMRTKGISGK